MTPLERDLEPRKVVRPVAGPYSVYDYPVADALRVAGEAAAEFGHQFARVTPSVGLAGQNVPARYLEVRGSPVVNFTYADGSGSFAVVAETERGERALELQAARGEVVTAEGTFARWDTELRAPDWRLIASEPELV